MKQTFFVATSADRLAAHVAIDGMELPVKVDVSTGRRRSLEQNAYLWGVCYKTILSQGLSDNGWRVDDLHEYFLGEYHGWQVIEGFGQKRKKPVERSSGKSTSEFSDYLEFVLQKAAELGIYIPEAE